MTQAVVATHVPGLLETFAALEYLDGYPHGCLEQKMAKLAPQLALARLSRQLGGFQYAEGVKAQVERLLAEMPLHQANDGLLSLWPGGVGNVQVTADALEFMALADQQKIIVDKALQAKTRDALQASLRSDYAWGEWGRWRGGLQSNALRALSRSGAVDDNYLVDAVRTRSALDATGRADLALALLGKAKTFAGDLDTLKGELWGAVTFNLVDGKRTVVDISDPRSSWGARVLGSSTSSLATVFEALVRVDPNNSDLQPVLQALLRQGAGSRGFGSTYDNRRAVAAVAAYVEQANPPTRDTKLTLNDKTFTLDGTQKVVRYNVDATTAPTAQATGEAVRARVRYRYLPETPGDRQAATKSGFLVERSMTVYPAAAGGGEGTGQRLDDKRAEERALSTGDIVEVHARFTTDAVRHNVAFVVPFAAGFEPLNPELRTSGSEAKPAEADSTTPTYVARLDHEVRYYFDRIGAGTWTFHFRLRATTPGSYVHPGARAELMYDESVTGTSDGLRVVIARGAAAAAADDDE
jgi:uncharacterized protein YfaS (alpha-2-macroglobulin family)